MKDYFDLRALARKGAVDPERLAKEIAATLEQRKTEVPDGVPTALLTEFAEVAGGQVQRNAFVTKNRLEAPPFPEVVREERDFAIGPLRVSLKARPLYFAAALTPPLPQSAHQRLPVRHIELGLLQERLPARPHSLECGALLI